MWVINSLVQLSIDFPIRSQTKFLLKEKQDCHLLMIKIGLQKIDSITVFVLKKNRLIRKMLLFFRVIKRNYKLKRKRMKSQDQVNMNPALLKVYLNLKREK